MAVAKEAASLQEKVHLFDIVFRGILEELNVMAVVPAHYPPDP
jgi:hypothetical protein